MGPNELELADRDTPEEVACWIAQGRLIAIQFGTVYALICNARDSEACAEMYRVKGRSREKPLSLQGDLGWIPFLANHWQIAPELQSLLLDGNKLRDTFGNTSFVRLPIIPQMAGKVIPECFISYNDLAQPSIQLFSFIGDPLAHTVEQTILQRLCYQNNLPTLIAITSLNRSEKQESILKPGKARKFCADYEVPILVHRSCLQADSSYSIVEVGLEGAKVIREGTGGEKIRKRLGIT